MSRYQTPYLQYFDAAGKPLAGGKLFFYEAGTNDLKTVFTDIDQTIPSENPVTLNANGSVSNIFYSGLARVVLQNATGTQVFDIDDVGPEDLSGLPPLYVSDATYTLNDVVKTADGLYYRSIQNGNAGNVPSPSSEYWEKIDFLYTYNANNSYQLDDVVKFGGQLYISTITANQGNSPATSNNWRKLTTLAEFEYLDGGLTLNKVNYPAGTKAHVKSFGSVTGGRNSYWVKQAVSGPASKLPSERLDLQCTDAIGAVWALQHGGVVYISSIGGNQSADNGLVFQAYDNKADILDLEGKEWPCTSLNTDSGSQREVLNSKVTNGRLIVTNSLGGETLVQTFSRHLDAEAQLSETKSPVIDWEGLNVLWLGTSIPHQGAGVDGYPERLGEALNFNAQNYAWSGSHAFYDIDGDAFDNATVRALTMTEVDRQAGLALYGPTSAYDDSFDLVTKPSQMTCDYRIKRQFETSPVDVVVLDHNHNDRKNIKDYTANVKTIGSVTLGALTTFDLTDVSGLNVGDGCYVRVEGIDNLDYAAGRITAIAGNDVTVGIDSTGFTGTFTSGQLHWVDRTTVKGAWDFLIAYTKNMGIQFGKEDVKIILCGAPSYFTNNVDRDHSIWSVNRAIREIAQDWDLTFFDAAHALRLTYRDHLTYLPDAVHPSTPETREIFTNVWAKWLRGGAGNFYNPQSVLQRNKTIDNEHDQPALYSKYDSAYAPRDVTYKEQDPLIDDDFSGGLGDWTQLGTGTPTVVSAPWGSGDAVQFSVLAANTAPYLRQDVAVGETPVLEFDFYLPSVDLATGTTQQLTIASISGVGGAGYSVTVTQTAGSEAQVRGTYNQGGFGLSPVVSLPNSAFTIEAATKYRARIDVIDGYAQFSIDGQVMFSGAIDNDLIGAATSILVGPTFTNMGSDFEVFIGNVVAQAKESLHVMTTAELQKTVQSYTLAELQAMSPTLTGRRVFCSDRADVPLKLMEDGYTALPGDITAANGRVWSIIEGVKANILWFGEYDGVDISTLIELAVNSGRFAKYELSGDYAFTDNANITKSGVTIDLTGCNFDCTSMSYNSSSFGGGAALSFEGAQKSSVSLVSGLTEGSTSITVSDASGVVSGDVLRIHSLEVLYSNGTAQAEMVDINEVDSVSGNVVNLKFPIKFNWDIVTYPATVDVSTPIESCHVIGGNFIGGGATETPLANGRGQSAVFFRNAKNVSFSDANIFNMYALGAGCERTIGAKFKNLHIEGRGFGVVPVEGVNSSWYGVFGVRSRNVNTEGCTGIRVRHLSDAAQVMGVIQANNKCYDSHRGAFGTHEAVFDFTAYGNTSEKCYSGMVIRSYDANVYGNNLEGLAGITTSIMNDGELCGLVSITNNTIASNGSFGGVVISGIYASLKIKGNSISNPDRGILVNAENVPRLSIVDNDVSAAKGVQIFESGQSVSKCNLLRVTDNDFYDVTGIGVEVRGSTDPDNPFNACYINENSFDCENSNSSVLLRGEGFYGENISVTNNKMFGDASNLVSVTNPQAFEQYPIIEGNEEFNKINYVNRVVAQSNAASLPSGSNVIRGSIINRRQPSVGQPVSWTCVSSGTEGSVSGVTGDISSGSNELTLTGNDSTKITLGAYITVAGAGASSGTLTARVIGISLDYLSLTIDTSASTTVSGATVQRKNPTYGITSTIS